MKALILASAVLLLAACGSDLHDWDAAQQAAIASLWIGNLGDPPPDPTNPVADDPRAAALGQRLFFDTRFSANGRVACATCHRPDRLFSDAAALGAGIGPTRRHTLSLVGAAWSPWLFWDGRADRLWNQALVPLEDPLEHGATRSQYVHLLARHYRQDYEALFGPLPPLDGIRFPERAGPLGDAQAAAAWRAMSEADRQAVNRAFANLGRSLAAYQRLLRPGPSRFDAYAAALAEGRTADLKTLLTPEEAAGLRLFIGRADCIHCHNGPLLTNNEFHNIGVAEAGGMADAGRGAGVRAVLDYEFNCLGEYSGAAAADCQELAFVKAEGGELQGAFRTPTLRNVADTAPYMHNGRFKTLGEVLAHYRDAPAAAAGKSELTPLDLSDADLAHLEAFLKTLSGPLAVEGRWLEAPPAAPGPDP